eukprot:CAMPEP_0117514474 /NCGR_PEP_ID=MMETSP0784-20121206/30087_1 /TAXON_ID=39447 /ORGANISM="" /LENGTH=502 /DNA_ID=CAMNT_0005310269 /DNA_START=1 /DNA_END=1510 /DNA_ORIENTATION=-
MASPWPELPLDEPFNFAALQLSLRTGVERRLLEQHESLERHARERSAAAEEGAIRRSEALIVPRLRSVEAQAQADLDVVRDRLQRLEERALSAETRLGALEAQAANHAKDSDVRFSEAAARRAELLAELRDSVARLDAQDVAQERRSEAIEASWNDKLSAAMEAAEAARVAVATEADARLTQARTDMVAMHDACLVRLSGLDDRTTVHREEAEASCLALSASLRHHEDETAANMGRTQLRFAECRAKDDQQDLTMAELRESLQHEAELSASRSNAITVDLQEVSASADRRLQALSDHTSESFVGSRKHVESLHDDQHSSLRATADVFHATIAQTRVAMGEEHDALWKKYADHRSDVERLVIEKEQQVWAAMEQRVDAACSALQHRFEVTQSHVSSGLDGIRHEIAEQARLADERGVHRNSETRTQCDAAANVALGQTAAALRNELENALVDNSRRLEGFVVAECEKILRYTSEDKAGSAGMQRRLDVERIDSHGGGAPWKLR